MVLPSLYSLDLNWPGNPDVEVVATFIAAIELRRNALAAQGSPIATSVLTGDVEAYIDMVHKPAGQIKPYNDRPSYPADVRAGVAAAKAQIGDGKTI